MQTFLSQVAKIYVKNEDDRLSDFTFVFPNKRSGVFFANYMAEAIENNIVMPQIITISDFIGLYSTGIEASRMELIFILYDEYRKIVYERSPQSTIIEFDRFQFWAEMLLNDFGDVDKYLVDAKQLFKNIKNLKEINSNFLTEEQINVIRQYWGDSKIPEYSATFWKHINHNEDGQNQLTDKFIKLWEILYDLYDAFRTRLKEIGLSYSGMLYREVAESIKFINTDSLLSDRYIFVGFNVLSTSEIKIFERLKAIDRADFYWDYNSPAYKYDGNRATLFVGNYINQFKSRYKLLESEIEEFPNINVIGVPSNIGQVKETAAIISKLNKEKKITDINTAIVLPDEGLFIPLLHSLPKDIKSVNVTMGYPMRHTSVSALISLIISMQMRSRVVHEKIQFFYEDIMNVLSHPLISSVASQESQSIIDYINTNREFNLTADFLNENYSQLKSIFTGVKDLNNIEEVLDYIQNLVLWISPKLPKDGTVDALFIEKYIASLEHFAYLIKKYGILMSETTAFRLIERIIGSEVVNFEGEPLKGLQIMGVLETRALDFENLFILSMNERVFPRKHYAKTFIPNSLRRGYGMSTIEFQESMYAYYFYRMLSRANNVYIMYDSRTGGLRSGEMSRFLYQLKFLYQRDKINFASVKYNIFSAEEGVLTVVKTPEIMAKLNEYKKPNSKRNFSASTLKKYIDCPLSFYLYYIEGLQYEDEITEYMDESTFGTIMHEIAEVFYTRLKGGAEEVLITKEILEKQKQRQGEIMKQITRSINCHYNKLGEDNDTPLHGDSKVLGDIMCHFTLLMFENEKQFADFYFVEAEKEEEGQWKINDKHTINFRMFIDRIDRVKQGDNMLMRFVDYKTGSDKVNLGTISQLFDKESKNKRHAIFQLFVYCFFYAYKTGYKGDIQPYIYTFRTLNTEHLPPITIGSRNEKKVLNSYLEYKDEFWALFENLIDEIFDEKVPFFAVKNKEACKYCKFMEFCNNDSK